MKSISVAMAAYNGQAYISKQIQSILRQLKPSDELVISLDPSSDTTQALIESFQDPRIKLIQGPGKGVISNFNNAISHTKNDIIFLCDQDDIWMDNKVEKVLSAFDKDTTLVVHDCIIVDSNLKELYPSFFKERKVRSGFISNIIKNSYMGACMAFKKELKEDILPIPDSIPMHDQWIGLIAQKKGKVKWMNTPLLYYRRHNLNVSNLSHSSIIQMVKWRSALVRALRKRGIL